MSGIVFLWDIDLSTLIGRRVKVETMEGISRTGVLNDVRFHDPIKILDREVHLPKEIVFETDSDTVTFYRIRSITLARARD
jgi:hypothetical protein